MRIENSPEFEAEMNARWEANEAEERRLQEARVAFAAVLPSGWAEITTDALALWEMETILVADAETVAVVRVTKRFGRPIFWEKPPERVMRDGFFYFEGGVEMPETCRPAWWWNWELEDFESYPSERYGRPEIDFIPTHWMPVPSPPKREAR